MSVIEVSNSSESDVEVLVSDSKGQQRRFSLASSTTEVHEVTPQGDVYVKLFRQGLDKGSGRQFGMMLAAADLTSCTVQPGALVDIVNGASGPVIKKD